MEAYEGKTPLEALIDALSERDMEYVIDEENNSLIVMDAKGNPHECWDGAEMVNVCVPMTVEDTVKYLWSTFRGIESGIIMMQKRENDKLQDENAKLRELVRGRAICDMEDADARELCPLYDVDEPNCCKRGRLMRELGIGIVPYEKPRMSESLCDLGTEVADG